MSAVPSSAFGKVAVLMGGTSAEREISLMSGTGVLAALRAQGVDAHAFDPAERELAELRREGFARCFIALHGRHGEDGTVQGALELLGIPYTGSGVMASAIAIDKVMTKRIWIAEGLPTPRFVRLAADQQQREQLRAVPDVLGLPLDRQAAARGLVDRHHQGRGLLADAGRGRARGALRRRRAVRAVHRRRRGDLPGARRRRRGACAAGDSHRRARRPVRLPEQVLHRRRPATECPSGLAADEEREIQRIVLAGLPHPRLPRLGPRRPDARGAATASPSCSR